MKNRIEFNMHSNFSRMNGNTRDAARAQAMKEKDFADILTDTMKDH